MNEKHARDKYEKLHGSLVDVQQSSPILRALSHVYEQYEA